MIFTMAKNKQGEWLEKKFLEWQMESGGRRTITQFAEYLNSSQPYVTMVMNGQRTPSFETVDKWAEKLGPEVYEVFGYDAPDPRVKELLTRIEKLPPDNKDKLFDMLADLFRAFGAVVELDDEPDPGEG